MAEARSRAAWLRTSSVLAMIANVNRDPKKAKAYTPGDFDPHGRERQKAPKEKVPVSILKDVFVRKDRK